MSADTTSAARIKSIVHKWMFILCLAPLWESGYSVLYHLKYDAGRHIAPIVICDLLLALAYVAIYLLVDRKADWLAKNGTGWRLPVWTLTAISFACAFTAIRLL